MYQMNKNMLDQWFKGVGAFLLIFIDVNYLLTTRFGRLKGNERYEAMWYLFILISIVVLPILLGKVLNYLSSILSKIINNWQVTNQSRNLEFLLSWGLGLVFNTIAIQKLFTEGTGGSLRLYMKPEMSYNWRELTTYLSSLNFLVLIPVGLILTVIFFFLLHLFSLRKFSRTLLIENIVFIGVLVTVTSVAWSLVYTDRSNFHFNVVLFPLAAINSDSPFIPLVDDGFKSLYGGYYLWLGLLSRLMGNNLLSIKIVVCSLIALQIILYYLIAKAIYKNPLLRILVFISCLFWSYFYGKVVSQDLYFQYFPLRTLFPCLLLVTLLYISERKFLDKATLSIGFLTINLRDLLLDFIVAMALLSNFDSGVVVLIMYFFIYIWNEFKIDGFSAKNMIKKLTGFSINFIIIIFIIIFGFRIIAGEFINFYNYIGFTLKFGSGFLGLPFPDNIWMIFMVVYGFNIIQSFPSPIEDKNAKYRFVIAIWGIVSLFYFVNRSHPGNLLAVSLPFFLSYGCLIDYVFSSYRKKMSESEPELMQNKMAFREFLPILLPNSFDLLRLSLVSVLIMPFIIMSLIASVKFIPATISNFTSPKSYSQMSAVASLSERVATLEKQLNRPSILLSDSFESYYYLHKNRKVLFYPETTSILSGDNSFQPRFIDALNKFNPIVTLCPIVTMTKENLNGTFLQLLYQNNYKLVESGKNIDDRILKNCKIYIKD
ncbi:conserved membrane hypothetical protein [Microcystis aeruginosa PCC 9809]|uniref:Uncharacterized protein n=1 Tax=Microcystis aeruginosa PCC 9809 TaxID=1160285 RepID=I4I4K2_MICAE|nr:hypothetical protein [Microcystis aeruginosa]CCI29226.1 conserved membrane hypothetical protein [Microcystis aeruginosa PCC 9809]